MGLKLLPRGPAVGGRSLPRREKPPLSHFTPSFRRLLPLLPLKDDGDSKDEHDDSESDGGAGGGDERDDDGALLLPMMASGLPQVNRSAAGPAGLHQVDGGGPGRAAGAGGEAAAAGWVKSHYVE